jgi:hypothetical protein
MSVHPEGLFEDSQGFVTRAVEFGGGVIVIEDEGLAGSVVAQRTLRALLVYSAGSSQIRWKEQ